MAPRPRVDCEAAIIGGGYTGLSCATHLARRIAGAGEENPIPPFASPLQRFPLHGLARVARAGAYQWCKLHDRFG